VFCRNTADVVNAARWARTTRLAFRARSGRRSLEGWSNIDSGLAIDVCRMGGLDPVACRPGAIFTRLSICWATEDLRVTVNGSLPGGSAGIDHKQ
jgi:FAD/FMN-containing dehydrogenase